MRWIATWASAIPLAMPGKAMLLLTTEASRSRERTSSASEPGERAEICLRAL